MISLDDFSSLQRRVADLQTKRDQTEGALQQVMGELLEKHGCKTIEDGEKLLEEKKELELEQAERYNAAMKKFKKEFKDQLEEG